MDMPTVSLDTPGGASGKVQPVRTVLRDILTPGVVGVSAGACMSKALECMSGQRISSVVVLTRGKPVGILTERGVIRAAAEHGASLQNLKISQVMTSPVLTAPEDMPIHQAFSLLLSEGIRHLVVVDSCGRAMGMVTQTNMIRNLGVEYFVEIKRVSQIMIRNVASLPSRLNLRDTLDLMVLGPYSCVVAMEDGVPAGIFSERDMVAAVSGSGDLDGTTLAQVMSSPVITITGDTPVHTAATMMGDMNVRRLLVTGEDGKVEGILTQSDIVKGLEARYVEMLKDVIREKDELLREAVMEAARKSVYLDTILNSSMDLGIAATEGGVIAFINQSAQDMFGVIEGDVIGRDIIEFHKSLGVPASRIRRVLSHVRKGNSHAFSTRLGGGAGKYIDGQVSGIAGPAGKPDGYVFMMRDVTERRSAENTIRHMAYHDALTGLPNRLLVADRLEQGLAQAKRRACLLAVMLLDLDGFKAINDSLGHNVGDELLKAIGARIAGLLRKSDTVGRMGGDEFLIVLPEVKTPEGAASVASKMLKAVWEPRVLAGREIVVSTSIGLALYPWDGADAKSLIQRADAAMYRAKEAGRNTYRFAGEGRDGQSFRHP
ncbi:diguanylate cyclase domain-containing protein [Fundidesulfovibrio terrae]|uniref:diguanylate cyclase domain-containing protein n=1 Tax=Fundidesulfovibrio terrae TaxID=2922866 RepID=UPI001FAF7E5D|nr:diguanylate cyclase [Fundidesulfovibrio terrae]